MGPESAFGQLSASAREALSAYEALLRSVAVPRGFVARADAIRLRERHVLDSLRALSCLGPGPQAIADLGSGAGLPGIPVAIARPDCSVTLVESQARRVAFLELVQQDLRLANVRILHGRAEAARLAVDVALARALSDPGTAWAIAEPNLRSEGFLIYFAGRGWFPPATHRSGGDVESTICDAASFPWQGPLVRMQRRPIRS